MQKSLCYDYQLAQDCIETTISVNATVKEYYDYVTRTLGCGIRDLAVLLTNGAFEDDSNCGERIESYFPIGAHLEVTVITTNFTTTGGFNIGEVLQVVYNGEKFIADRHNGLFGVFAKYEFNAE